MATASNVALQDDKPELVEAPEGVEFYRRLGSISRQSAVYFLGTIFTAAAGYFFKVYLARRLGAEALGLYALGMSLVGIVGLFNAIGLPATAARFVAEYSARGDFARLGGFLRRSVGVLTAGNLLLAVVVMWAGPWVAVHFYHAPGLGPYLWTFALIMLFGVLTTFLGQVMAGYRDVARRTVITQFIGTPATIAAAVVLISLGWGFRGYMVAQVGSGALVLGLLAVAVWKMTPAPARVAEIAAPVERKVMAFSAVAFAAAAVDFALSQSDKIVLGCYLAPQQVGVYAVAMALVGFVPIALQSVNQIFSPIIAELHAAENREMLQRLYGTLTKWIVMLTIPLALTMVVFARPLMGIFGAGFQTGAEVLAIGAVAQLINCGVGSVGFLLMMSGHQVQMVKIQGANAVLMIVLSIFLVPRMGITGAALAAAIAVVTTNLWSLAAVRSRLGLFPYHAGYFKLVLPTLVAIGAVVGMFKLFGGIHASGRMAGLALICAYGAFAGAVALLGLDGEDRQIARMVRQGVTQTWRREGRDI